MMKKWKNRANATVLALILCWSMPACQIGIMPTPTPESVSDVPPVGDTETSHTLDDSQLIFVKNMDYLGDTYSGLWQNGKPEIFGVLYNQNDNFCYLGGFKSGLFHSVCTYYSILLERDGTRFRGYFRDGRPVVGVLHALDGYLYKQRDEDGRMLSVNTYTPLFESEYSHMVWDDYGKSFHLFNGFGFGDSQDEISPSSGYTVIEFENGDYFLGEMFDGAPTHGLYYTESNGDFYLGGYKYMVEESAESGVLPVFSWEEDEVMMLMKKTDNVIEVSDYFAYSIRNFKITEDDLENFFVLGQPVSETESPMPNSAAPSQDPNDRPGEANPPAPTKTPESTTKTCQDCGGSGRVFCTDCDGSGYISFAVGSDQQKMTCFGCDGTGKRVCYSCDGTGKISESPSQGGSEAPYVPDYDPPQAPDASGGRTTCVMCNGSGKRTCTTCGGSGTLSQNKVGIDGSYYVDVTCTLCDGTGRMICSGCYGKGSY